jgi:hypothetical protein
MFELFSTTLYPHLDARTANWVIAFDEDGRYYVDHTPGSDFWVPVPYAYATREGAEAGIAAIKAWEAPVAAGEDVLSLEALRATPEWAALLTHVHMRQAIVPDLSVFDFNVEIMPGAYDHYRAITLAGAQVL